MTTAMREAPGRVGSRLSTAAVLMVWVAVGAALAGVAGSAFVVTVLPPLPGRPTSDGMTAVASLMGSLIARLASAACLGTLAAVVAFLPGSGQEPEGVVSRRLSSWVVRSAQVWCAAALMMTFANPSFLVGTSVGAAFRPDAWWAFVTSMPSALAWLGSALAALCTVVVGYRAPSRAALILAWLAGAGTSIWVAVTGSVTVGLDHDWATDGMALATLAATVLGSGAVGALAALEAGVPADQKGFRRYQRAAAPLLLVIVGGYTIAAWQQLAGRSPFDVLFGGPVVVGAAVVAGLVVSWGWRAFLGPRAGAGAVAWDVVLLIVGVACLTVAEHLPAPRFGAPQTIQINYLGYEVDVPATAERIAGLGRPNLLWLVLAVGAISLYVWGMVRARRRGTSWPVSRLLFWLAGWGLMLYLAISGLWMYSTAVFSWHMLVHMTVNMLVPLLCVLGAPFGLAAAASRDPGAGALPGIREVLGQLADSRLVRVVLSPPAVWAVYVFSLFLVYFSPLFPWLMRYHWGHQLMLLHFMAAGYAFFAMLVGPDYKLSQLPYVVKFALLVSVMPFHAFFAVGIMMARGLIGEQFYASIAVGWVGDLLADQDTAGQITWFTGEIPAFIAVLMLAAQWFRSDTKQAAAADRLVDAGEAEDELAAYNQLLAELAARDRLTQDGTKEEAT